VLSQLSSRRRPPIMDAMGDAVLQQLLQQGLSAYQRDAAQQPVPSPALQLDSALLTSPEFRMYCYKARAGAGRGNVQLGLWGMPFSQLRAAPACWCRLCLARGATGTTGGRRVGFGCLCEARWCPCAYALSLPLHRRTACPFCQWVLLREWVGNGRLHVRRRPFLGSPVCVLA
jgi:hypothetical protein